MLGILPYMAKELVSAIILDKKENHIERQKVRNPDLTSLSSAGDSGDDAE